MRRLSLSKNKVRRLAGPNCMLVGPHGASDPYRDEEALAQFMTCNPTCRTIRSSGLGTWSDPVRGKRLHAAGSRPGNRPGFPSIPTRPRPARAVAVILGGGTAGNASCWSGPTYPNPFSLSHVRGATSIREPSPRLHAAHGAAATRAPRARPMGRRQLIGSRRRLVSTTSPPPPGPPPRLPAASCFHS